MNKQLEELIRLLGAGEFDRALTAAKYNPLRSELDKEDADVIAALAGAYGDYKPTKGSDAVVVNYAVSAMISKLNPKTEFEVA